MHIDLIKEKNKSPNITTNFLYTLGYQVIAMLVPLITTPYISRIFIPGSLGVISYATTINNYFLLVGNLGMATYAQIEISRIRDDKVETSNIFYETVISRAVSLCVIISIYFVFIFTIGREDLRMMYIVLTANMVGSLLDLSWFYQGKEQFRKVAVRNTAIKLLSMAMIFIFIKKPEDIYLYVLILYGSTVIANIYLWLGVNKQLSKLKLSALNIKRHLKGYILFFFPSIASVINSAIGITLLGKIGNIGAESGYFEQAFKIFNIIITIPASLSLVMRPRMALLYANNASEELKEKFYTSMRFIMFMMIAIGLGLIGTSDNVVGWFLGDEWTKVSLLLKIFGVNIIFYSIMVSYYDQYFIPRGKVKTAAALIYSGLATNVIASFLLDGKLGSVGASLAVTASELIMMSLAIILARKDVKVTDILKMSVKYILAGSVMLFVLLKLSAVLAQTVFSFLLLMLVGFVVYCLALILMRDVFILGAIKELVRRIKTALK